MESMDNMELYIIVGLFLFIIWFISNTIKYYHGEKRKVKNLHRFAKKGDVDAQGYLARHYQKAAFSGNNEANGYLQKFLENHKNKKKKKC